MKLFPFQEEGVAWAVAHGRAVIADDRGLGKTPQALMTLERTDSYPAVVVVPAGHSRTSWGRECQAWLPHRTVTIAHGRPGMLKSDITIIGYPDVHKWAPVAPWGYRGMVLDEAHRIKNAATRQSRAVIELSRKAAPDAVMLALTGTIAPNGRNGETVLILRAIRRLDEFGGISGVTRMGKEQLHERLVETCYLRRLKADVMSDLPARMWNTLNVDVTPPADYLSEETALAATLASEARDGGNDWEALLQASAGHYRASLTHLCGLLAKVKESWARQWVSEFLQDTDRKVITFATRRSVVSGMADHFRAPRIQGGQNDTARARDVDSFQGDPQVRVISCNMAAAGEGLTLTAASDVLFIEKAWTPGAMDQCLDRAHRIGQSSNVTGWVMNVPGTVDDAWTALLDEKRLAMDAIQDGRASAGADHSVLGGLVVHLARKGLTS